MFFRWNSPEMLTYLQVASQDFELFPNLEVVKDAILFMKLGNQL